ncbi:MAG: hypothetical protein AAGC60_29200 [Acidobacteriota bacterium]
MKQASIPRLAPTALFVLPILFGLCALLAAPALAQPPATAPFDRTIIVGGGGTDAANGTALLTAVNDALAAVPAPSAGNPWLIKVEPGIFDLGSQTLQLQSWIDIEGSGRNATFIRSGGSVFVPAPATVNAASGVNSELRNLTVQYFSNIVGGIGIQNASTELKLTQVNVEVEASDSATGVLSTAGNPRLSAVFSRVSSTNGGVATGFAIRSGAPVVLEMFVFIKNETQRENIGISVSNGAAPVLEKISGVVFGGSRNIGILSSGSSPSITNNRWTVSNGEAIGVLVPLVPATILRPVVELKESTIEATNASRAIGLSNESGGSATRVEVKDTTIRASASQFAAALPIAARNVNNGSFTKIDQSVLDARIALSNQTAGTTFQVGASQLAGVRNIIAGSTAVCAASYDIAYTTLPPGC